MSSFSLNRNLFAQLWDMQDSGANQLLIPYAEETLRKWDSHKGRLVKISSSTSGVLSSSKKMVLVRIRRARRVAERIHVDLWLLWKTRDERRLADQCVFVLDSMAVRQDARIQALEGMVEILQARVLELQVGVPRLRRAAGAGAQGSPPPLYSLGEGEFMA